MEKKRFIQGILIGTFGTVTIGLVGILIWILIPKFTAEEPTMTSDSVMLKMNVLKTAIDHYYLDDVEEDDLIDGIYHGIVDALDDPYSTYYSVSELEALMEQTQGSYSGIGAYIGIHVDVNLPTIANVIPGTPAEEAGLQQWDIIYQIDGVETVGFSLEDTVALVKGEEGTTVTLTILREGTTEYQDIEIERRRIESATVTYEIDENQIAHICIYEFDDVTVDQFTDALETVKGQGMKGLILDLRGNPGGNVDSVVEIARKILPAGLIVYTEDKYGERVEYSGNGTDPLEVPLVVLIDSNSASASEILAGAISDYEVGTLIGTQTFGKGIVQSIIPLSDDTALKLTVSKYYTPNGVNIHGVGIAPDIEVEFDTVQYLENQFDNQLDVATKYLLEQLEQ